MLEKLKYGDLIKIDSNLQMIKYLEKLENGYYKLILKDMITDKIREENWIHDAYSETYSLANIIYNNVY